MNVKEVTELAKLFVLQGMTTEEAVKVANEVVEESDKIQYKL
ncbi:hypothetical protein [Terrisporobacter sp.]|nr:hypothetical protein [Terrisporobacter sp.]